MGKIAKKKNNFQKQSNSKVKGVSKIKLVKTPKNRTIKKAFEILEVAKPTNLISCQEEFTKIKPETVIKALNGVLKLHNKIPNLKNQLFEEDFPIFLQISCYRVPKGYSKIYRIPLKHSLYNHESEVCIIVSEIKGLKNIEHDQHKEHYEKLFSDKGISNLKNIMTFHEFRTEYETVEQKHRLVDLYDVFLADSKISGKVVKKCGKIFYNKRKVPTSVKLQMTKLKEHIDKSLSKTFLHMHLKGNCYSVQFGHSKMAIKELQENFQSIKQFLEKDFPGGMKNIMGLQIFAPGVSSIPVYFSTKSGKDIEVPKIPIKKPKAFKTYRDELTTLPDAEVIVKPSGKVIVKRITHKDDETYKDNTEDKLSEELKGTSIKRIDNAIAPSEVVKKGKSKKHKRKIAQITEAEVIQDAPRDKSTKRKKVIPTIGSGNIQDEAISGELTLGDQDNPMPSFNSEVIKEEKSKKHKRKTAQITDAEVVQDGPRDTSTKRRKVLPTIGSRNMQDEAISGELTLGDQDNSMPSFSSECIKEKKSKKHKRKLAQITEAEVVQDAPRDKSTKGKKAILTIGSGKILDEATSGELTLEVIKEQKSKKLKRKTAHITEAYQNTPRDKPDKRKKAIQTIESDEIENDHVKKSNSKKKSPRDFKLTPSKKTVKILEEKRKGKARSYDKR